MKISIPAWLRIDALLLVIISTTMLIPVMTAAVIGETHVISAFLIPTAVCWSAGLIILLLGKNNHVRLSVRDGFFVVATCWTAAGLLGAVPLVLSGCAESFTDAFFESISGFTTTGATIFPDVESLPRSINLWRTQMHWLGGMGIVALTVALLPLLGVGGFQLIKAETTGPEKGKITPKITVTAKILWFIYLGMTALQTLLLLAAGMDFIDSLSHAFATLGTGGFSSKNASIGGFNSPAIEWICTVFMILAGVNFSLYYRLFTGRAFELIQNTEFKTYIGIILVSSAAVAAAVFPAFGSISASVRAAFFQVASIITTTGFSSVDFSLWVPAAQMVLLLLMFVGGCSGSTGGSIKVVRWVVLWKQMINEMHRMLHPHGIHTIRLNGRAGRKDIVYSTAAFIFLYLFLVFITALAASFDGKDLITSFSASLAMVGNIGPGFGLVGPAGNYSTFAPWVKWVFSFAMTAGRLELFTIFVFFIPSFWKR